MAKSSKGENNLKSSQTFYQWRPHPWHGLEVGLDSPLIVHAYIEITPFDLIKYERWIKRRAICV